jgi:hypothetical protein
MEANEGDRFVCPFCSAVSFNLNDVRESYCGRCHRFADCPVCGGDCAGANPPVSYCPMRVEEAWGHCGSAGSPVGTEGRGGMTHPETTDADLLAIMNRICHHQVAKVAHPLTCGNDSRHQNLFPVIHGRRVILRCVDCDYAQEHIPGLFVKSKGHFEE